MRTPAGPLTGAVVVSGATVVVELGEVVSAAAFVDDDINVVDVVGAVVAARSRVLVACSADAHPATSRRAKAAARVFTAEER